jgi:hypothetical protein
MKIVAFTVLFLSTCISALAQAHMYSDTTYNLSKNKSQAVIIQNSLPKGGGYRDPAGKNLGYVVFWTRIKNETSSPLELSIEFPDDPFTTYLRPGSVFKIFLPTDTMTLDKEGQYDFGAKGLKSLLDTGIKNPTRLQKTIQPKEDYFFYTAILIQAWPPGNGSLRTGLFVKGEKLFYNVQMSGFPESGVIPCGNLIFKH